jgi:integrase
LSGKIPEEPKERYVPPKEDIKKVIMAADPDDTDLIQILYFPVGRITEILNLKWDDINFEHNWIRLWTRKRRGGELQEGRLALICYLKRSME